MENGYQGMTNEIQKIQAQLTENYIEDIRTILPPQYGQFYRSCPDFEICYTLCSELSWSHNRLIMRVDDSKARMFYLPYMPTEEEIRRQIERKQDL